MTKADKFVEEFLSHEYDPVKAREYYLRTRELKGRGDGSTEYEKKAVGNAQTQLNADLKKIKVKMNPKRRIGAAEQKLIRARSLAMRVKDPTVRADMLARLSAAEGKLKKIAGRQPGAKVAAPATKAAPVKATKTDPRSNKTFDGKPLPKRGTRMNEDETPEVSPSGAKLLDYSGQGLGRATYADGRVYDARTGWSRRTVKTSSKSRASADAKIKARARARAAATRAQRRTSGQLDNN